MARIAALIVALFASASALAPTRRNFLGKVAGAVTGASVAAPALADTDYAGLPYLGGSGAEIEEWKLGIGWTVMPARWSSDSNLVQDAFQATAPHTSPR